jgi:DamX protein
MAEINTFARVQQLWNDEGRAPVQFLLTQERTQVLDLLIHLISNSADSILLCGPEGVGKSKLLQVLQGYEIPSCAFYFVEANPELSLEAIQQHLNKSFNPEQREKYSGTLGSASSGPGVRQQKKVLIIDNAGSLAPGLITAIIHYAERNPQTRVILALTHDQLHLKYRSDQVSEDCHIVELPPFTEKQCGEFLQHLSAKASSGVSADALTDDRISLIYRQTHGVPARIISGYSVSTPRKRTGNPTGILVTAVALLVAVALAVQWFSSGQTVPEASLPREEPAKSPTIDLDLPYLTFPKLDPEGAQPNNNLQFDNSKKATQDKDELLQGPSLKPEATPNTDITPSHDEGLGQETANQPNPENSRLTEASTPPAQELKPVETQSNQEADPAEATPDDSVADDDSSVWLSSQPQSHYTLQLMVLSKRQSILNVMNKYPSLQQNFRYVRRMVQNKEKFILLYGSFSDAVSANNAKKTLPAEFQKAMARKIGAIQKEFGLLPESR